MINKQYSTCTDFNELNRKAIIIRHKSKDSALRAWNKWVRIYNKFHKYSLWIEDSYGNIIKKIESYGNIDNQDGKPREIIKIINCGVKN